MKLSLQTDYSLRTLMYLATRKTRVTIDEITEFFQISRPHVAKVVNHLARHGYIRSIRGIGGGLELAKEPALVSIGEIVALVEGTTHLLDCISIDDVCVIQQHCRLKNVLAKAEQVQLDYLGSVTLADVLPMTQSPKRTDRKQQVT